MGARESGADRCKRRTFPKNLAHSIITYRHGRQAKKSDGAVLKASMVKKTQRLIDCRRHRRGRVRDGTEADDVFATADRRKANEHTMHGAFVTFKLTIRMLNAGNGCRQIKPVIEIYHLRRYFRCSTIPTELESLTEWAQGHITLSFTGGGASGSVISE